MPAQYLHVTLLFLGAAPESRLGDVFALGKSVARSGVLTRGTFPQLEFNAVEFWKKSKVLVAIADMTQSSALAIAAISGVLRAEADRTGLVRDSSDVAPFRPHVTLVRDRSMARRGAGHSRKSAGASGKKAEATGKRKIDPVTWSFRDFVLVDSRTTAQGSIYSVLETFPFE